MYSYKRLMVGLDFTFVDRVMIQYVSLLSKMISPEKIYFINFQKSLDIPEGIRDKYTELNRPIDEKYRERMIVEVNANFPNHKKFDIEYSVEEGTPIDNMLRWGHIKNIDLMVAGRKSVHEGSGDLARRMARKGMCSALFIPQTAKKCLDNIFVSIDFSDYSQMALEEAWALAEKNEKAKIFCYHVYHLPVGYYSTGKTEKEFAQIMYEHAVGKYKELIDKVKIPSERITPLFELSTVHTPAAMISQAAHNNKADIILVGAKGRTAAASVLQGSVTEKLVTESEDIPLLVVKRKDKSFDFYDLIKNI